MKIDKNSHIPLYVQIEEIFLDLIKKEEYRNGAPLPGETELANRFGISRNTVRQATNKLELEGKIVRKKGIGTFVAQDQLSTQLDKWYSFSREMMDKGVPFEDLEFTTERVRIDKKMGDFFRVPEGTKVLKLNKLIGINDVPVVFFESYFAPRIKLDDNFEMKGPLYKILEDRFGIEAVKSSEKINAKLAGRMAKALKINPNDPILLRERSVYDEFDQAIEFNRGYYRADKFTYAIDIFK